MEYIISFLTPIIVVTIMSWLISSIFNTNENNIELSNNKYYTFEENKIPYKENNQTFKVKVLKIKNAKSNSLSRVYLIIGFKDMPKKNIKLKINQLDKNENIINFEEEYIPVKSIQYNKYENKTLFSEYTEETIPKFYTTTMDFFIDDCNITEYFQYQIIN